MQIIILPIELHISSEEEKSRKEGQKRNGNSFGSTLDCPDYEQEVDNGKRNEKQSQDSDQPCLSWIDCNSQIGQDQKSCHYEHQQA